MLYRIDETHVVYNNDCLEHLDFYRIDEDGNFEPLAYVEYMYSNNPKVAYSCGITDKEKEMVNYYLSEI